MAELFKNIYNDDFFAGFTVALEQEVLGFDSAAFLAQIFDADWQSRELKQRMRHISHTLNDHLPGNYEVQLETVLAVIAQLQKDGYKEDSLEYMFFPDFVEVYGLGDFEISVMAFEHITKFTSCEFAVRPFLIKYQEPMIKQVRLWAMHDHASVRRLASEGSRPRLPWAMALPAFKKDPTAIMPIFDTLKNDASESVRRSVANNLNDISKDNPDIVIDLVKRWRGESMETDRLLKHASRTLLKQGNTELMQVFGFGSIDKIKIADFRVLTPVVNIGGVMEFVFTLINTSNAKSKLRLEYGLYYQKANGSLSRKVFKMSEKHYAPLSRTDITRKQSFKVITTRKYHIGEHQISLIVNGIELQKLGFQLSNI